MVALYCGHPMRTDARRLCRWRIYSDRACGPHGTVARDAIEMSVLMFRERAMRIPPAKATGGYIASRDTGTSRQRRRAAAPQGRELPAAVADRDLGGVCWWLVEQSTTSSEWDARWAGVTVQAVRLLVTLPALMVTPQEARDEAFLRGKILNGIPPETEDEWALAEAIFTDAALEEFRSWNPLWERDDGDVDEPLVLGQSGGVEIEVPGLVEDED